MLITSSVYLLAEFLSSQFLKWWSSALQKFWIQMSSTPILVYPDFWHYNEFLWHFEFSRSMFCDFEILKSRIHSCFGTWKCCPLTYSKSVPGGPEPIRNDTFLYIFTAFCMKITYFVSWDPSKWDRRKFLATSAL